MIRTVAQKATFLAAATLLVGSLAVVNCAKKETPSSDVGSVGLAVQLSPGVTLNSVAYRITGNGITPLTGSIAVGDPGATVAVLISGIPAGMGYLVELNGTSTNGSTTCLGSATFNVIANQSTAVSVLLQCRAVGTTGSVVVTGGINNCPAVTSTVAAPLSAAAPAGIITIGATAADLDMGATLTYAWTATGGTFAAPTSANTTYTCAVAGAQTLTVTVSDGTCTASSTIPVNCVALTCGNGVVDMGEQCEPPNTVTCSAACQRNPICGNGTLEGTEMCDPPNGTTCDSMCRGIPIVCGNSIVQPGEMCDPPLAGVCTATCQSFMATCGDGIVNQSTEQCEPPNTATCSATCQTIVSACQTCETANCDPALTGSNQPGFSAAQRTACLNLLDCIRTTHCANNAAGDVQPCFCGTANDIQCLSGMANGACLAQIQAAAGSTAPDVIATNFVDPVFPIGRAVNTITCDTESCSTQCPR